MRVTFIAPFDWDVPEFNGRVTIHRPMGWVGTVKRDHGEAAIKAGKAVEDGTENRRRSSARGVDRRTA